MGVHGPVGAQRVAETEPAANGSGQPLPENTKTKRKRPSVSRK